jgi:hypothetical protein
LVSFRKFGVAYDPWYTVEFFVFEYLPNQIPHTRSQNKPIKAFNTDKQYLDGCSDIDAKNVDVKTERLVTRKNAKLPINPKIRNAVAPCMVLD